MLSVRDFKGISLLVCRFVTEMCCAGGTDNSEASLNSSCSAND